MLNSKLETNSNVPAYRQATSKQTPNPEYSITETNSEILSLKFDHWSLGIIWLLVLGNWLFLSLGSIIKFSVRCLDPKSLDLL